MCDLITHPPLTTLMDIVSCRSHDVASKTSPRTSVLLPHIPGRSKMNIYKEIRTKNDARILRPRIYLLLFFIFFYSIMGQKEKEKQFMNLKKILLAVPLRGRHSQLTIWVAQGLPDTTIHIYPRFRHQHQHDTRVAPPSGCIFYAGHRTQADILSQKAIY